MLIKKLLLALVLLAAGPTLAALRSSNTADHEDLQSLAPERISDKANAKTKSVNKDAQGASRSDRNRLLRQLQYSYGYGGGRDWGNFGRRNWGHGGGNDDSNDDGSDDDDSHLMQARALQAETEGHRALWSNDRDYDYDYDYDYDGDYDGDFDGDEDSNYGAAAARSLRGTNDAELQDASRQLNSYGYGGGNWGGRSGGSRLRRAGRRGRRTVRRISRNNRGNWN